jgi:SAM-dependent methyltransferase
VLAEVIQPGAKVLDVGSGSGYMSACFALLVGVHGHVYAIDHVKELVEQSIRNIQKDNPQLLHRITTKVGDGTLGWPEHAPYDVIYVGAAAESISSHSFIHTHTLSLFSLFFLFSLSLLSLPTLIHILFFSYLHVCFCEQRCHKLYSINSSPVVVFLFVNV